ncbi:MAG: hypothetical protein AAFY02_01560 [Pseudomonadota bacterium]
MNTNERLEKETTGAWIVHHGRKISLDATAAAEFSAIDEAAKAATLLVRLGESDETTLTNDVVRAVARSAGLNPRYELEGLLTTLQRKRLIDRSTKEVAVLGITTRGVLGQAAELFENADPQVTEFAAIKLAETVSRSPSTSSDAKEYLSDEFRIPTREAADFLTQSEQIGFVDAEGEGPERLLFNGHLFKRDNVSKAAKVISSLSSADQNKISEFDDLLKRSGCLPASEGNKILGHELFKKLLAVSLYDTHVVSNEKGENVFVTSPGAFHKFVDPLVDDTFDMAKALVAALYYGMTRSNYSRGQIHTIDALLGKLINGGTVGPATAIGQDYRVLEERRVVRIVRCGYGFTMRLLKTEVGQLALQVLRSGDASAAAVVTLPSAPMSAYGDPESARTRIRKTQSSRSKRQTLDVLSALRSGRAF